MTGERLGLQQGGAMPCRPTPPCGSENPCAAAAETV
jgi:hypothetical protein